MTFDDDDRRMAAAVSEMFARYDVPPVPHARIEAEAARRMRLTRPRAPGRLRVAARVIVAAAIVLAAVASPQLSHGVVNAARTFLDRPWTFWRGNGPARVVNTRETSLARARASRAVHFVEPRGLPAGSRLTSVGEANAAHAVLTLVYRAADRVFSVDEVRAGRGRAHASTVRQSCIDVRGSSYRTLQEAIRAPAMRRYLETNDPADLPRGVTAVPCIRTSIVVDGTIVTVRNVVGRLTGAEIDSILRATSH
jgi:hypothetical protein